ncbi:MAG: hypothetical protein J6I79_03785 [Paludibacteraceae bacterium]|nr:hypothetical protein [Paludibacteraceae bacterium]
MTTIIANPIYDSVFNYLMEDQKAAKIILSALLQKPVVDLKMKRNEYTQAHVEGISVFRIDFAAAIVDKDEDGNEKKELVTIELQKAWIPGEIFRFRKYLGNQYSDEENSFVVSEKPLRKSPTHIITIYLLGHSLHELEIPVAYIYPKIYDQFSNKLDMEVRKIPFADALVHDMIIVQIPRLTNMRVVSHLDKLLSIFDQSRKSLSKQQQMNIDNDFYDNDSDIKTVVSRLEHAFHDDETRKTMDMEDELSAMFYDFEQIIMKKEHELKELDDALKEIDYALKKKDDALKEIDVALKEKDEQLLTAISLLRSLGLDDKSIAEKLNIDVKDL